MNSYTLKEVTNKKELAAMIDLPWKLYANDPNWVPPLKMAVHDLFKPKHPFYETSELKSWMAEDAEGNICGRIIAVVNDHYNKFHEQKIGFFGFFEAENNSFLAKTLFDAAEGWLKDKGMTIKGAIIAIEKEYSVDYKKINNISSENNLLKINKIIKELKEIL